MKPKISPLVTRRQFTRALLTAAGAAATAPAFLRGQSLNDKLNIAVIGTGGRGGSNLASVSSQNIVALCDVNANNLNAAAAKHPLDHRRAVDHQSRWRVVLGQLGAEEGEGLVRREIGPPRGFEC